MQKKSKPVGKMTHAETAAVAKERLPEHIEAARHRGDVKVFSNGKLIKFAGPKA